MNPGRVSHNLIHSHINRYKNTHIHTLRHTHTLSPTHSHTYTHTPALTQTHTHTHTHTHIPSLQIHFPAIEEMYGMRHECRKSRHVLLSCVSKCKLFESISIEIFIYLFQVPSPYK